jgi:8-oxo-dGTP pyrophosphatase MutT (NUDIX family)
VADATRCPVAANLLRVTTLPDGYSATLPRKRMAAGVLIRDRAGRVLLVEPVYKDYWELPGGCVEADESPYAAAERELKEELNISVVPGRLTGCRVGAAALKESCWSTTAGSSTTLSKPRFSCQMVSYAAGRGTRPPRLKLGSRTC